MARQLRIHVAGVGIMLKGQYTAEAGVSGISEAVSCGIAGDGLWVGGQPVYPHESGVRIGGVATLCA